MRQSLLDRLRRDLGNVNAVYAVDALVEWLRENEYDLIASHGEPAYGPQLADLLEAK